MNIYKLLHKTRSLPFFHNTMSWCWTNSHFLEACSLFTYKCNICHCQEQANGQQLLHCCRNCLACYTHTHTHTHPFNGPLSGTTQVSQYQKGKTNLDFTEARDSEWQWNPLGHMQLCTSLRTDNHARTPPLSFLTGRMPFMPPNQQRQSTEGKHAWHVKPKNNRGCIATPFN